MSKLINIGFGNVVNTDKVVAVVSPDAAPIKRMVQSAKESGKSIDATQGRKTKAAIITNSEMPILSALQPETIAKRFGTFYENDLKGEQDG
ncbi:DUF370 domain-containing protein [Blautia sp. RD014234]|nr:DUF370 domain-containing protein [Blautia parvula]